MNSTMIGRLPTVTVTLRPVASVMLSLVVVRSLVMAA